MSSAVVDPVDRAQIMDVLARYCRGLDGRLEEFLGVFWEDGVIASPLMGKDYVGPDGLREMFDAVHADSVPEAYRFGHHRTTNVIIDSVDDDKASVWCSFIFVAGTGQPQILAYGEYHDVLSKREGSWKFDRREIALASDAITVDPS